MTNLFHCCIQNIFFHLHPNGSKDWKEAASHYYSFGISYSKDPDTILNNGRSQENFHPFVHSLSLWPHSCTPSITLGLLFSAPVHVPVLQLQGSRIWPASPMGRVVLHLSQKLQEGSSRERLNSGLTSRNLNTTVTLIPSAFQAAKF